MRAAEQQNPLEETEADDKAITDHVKIWVRKKKDGLLLLKRWFSKLPFCIYSYTRSKSSPSKQYPNSFTRFGWEILPRKFTSHYTETKTQSIVWVTAGTKLILHVMSWLPPRIKKKKKNLSSKQTKLLIDIIVKIGLYSLAIPQILGSFQSWVSWLQSRYQCCCDSRGLSLQASLWRLSQTLPLREHSQTWSSSLKL